MKKVFTVQTANWHKDVVLEVTEKDRYRDVSMEAATVAVECFFQGDVRVDDINKPHTIDHVIIVREKDGDYINWLYAPVVVANAGYYKEANVLKQKIIMDNYESWD
tara:strand:+ start:528 stop:845 length:318 start_codon:yes stop_codon:yes gene_type:complete